jgi:outer membrane protein insertion porin family
LFASHALAAVELRELAPKDAELLKKELPALFSSASPEPSQLDDAIRLIMLQGTYENVFVQRDGGSVQIIGKPLRLIEEIRFTGTDEISESDLRDLLEIKAGDRFDRKKAVAAAEKIKNYYGEQGFFNAVVELNFNKGDNKNITLSLDIQEKSPCRIKTLSFETANRDLKAKLNSKFKKTTGRILTMERARQLMLDLDQFLIKESYLATEVLALDARYNDAKTEAYLQIEVREPYRWEFYISGYKFETELGVKKMLDLYNRERKNVDPAGEGAERIRRGYLDIGFPNVAVDTKVVNPQGTFLKRVYFNINEGMRVKIKSIEVQGRITRSSNYYENFIRHNSSNLVRKGYYNRQDLDHGFKNLITELRNQGFLKARALSSRVEYNDKKDQATIFLLLEEGSQTQIRALDFEGNRFFSAFELAQVTGLQTNSPLALSDFEASLDKLKNFYRSQGFLEMRLLNESEDVIQYNDKGTQARILFRIFEGPRIRIHSIAVEGNTFTKTRVILKEADFKVGEVLTPTKIDDATIRLNKMGLFSRADVRTLEEGTNVAERTLIISVSERDPGVFRLGGGVSNERQLTVRGFTGISYNNLAGTGRAVSTRVELKSNVAEVKYPEHEITAGYLEPFLFNTRTRGRLNLTRSERVFEYDSDNALTRITTSNRLDLLAERDLTRVTKLTWKAWSIETRQEWERNGWCIPGVDSNGVQLPFDPALGKCPPDTLQIATLGPTLDIDYRDNPFLPTRGSFTRFILDYSNPEFGSTNGVEFFRAEANYTHYTRINSPRWVWANSIRGGYLRNLSDDPESGVPTSYAFLLGGIYTVRGFDSASDNERIPKDSEFPVARGNQKLIKTNSQYHLVKSELRFPIVGEHGGVVFYDGAKVHVSGVGFRRSYRDAVGFGYRYNTPVGPLAIDLAFKINPERNEAPKEEIFRFHLSIGTF